MDMSRPMATAAHTRGARAEASTAKVIVGMLAITLTFVVSPMWAAALLTAFVVVLWRWPGVGWLSWSILLGAGFVLAVLTQPGVTRSPFGGAPRSVPPAVATLPPHAPAAATATVIARQVNAANEAYDRGVDLWHAGDSVAAIEALTRAIDMLPNWGDPYNLRALVRVSAGQFDAALDDAQSALDLDSSDSKIDTLDTRAYVLLKRGDYAAAQADYDAVLAAPGAPPAASLLGRGIVYAHLGQLEPARADLKEGLRLSGDLEVDPQLADLKGEATRTMEIVPQAANSA
jgi:tetratricopeptide (TPR) repeat protein